MSTPESRPPFPRRRSNESRRGGSRRAEEPTPTVCRGCKQVPPLPNEDTCEACGEIAIARTRASVDVWLSMHAERVKELERVERAQNERA